MELPEYALDLCGTGCSIALTEERGITVLQLHGVRRHVIMHGCEWSDSFQGTSEEPNPNYEKPLKPEEINLYQVCENLIKPATAERKCSFVELIANAPQPPRWFISHWWGEPIQDFVTCVDAHSTLRHLPKTTSYWVCAYANNQWELGHDVADDPYQTSFRKALDLSEGTLSIIDMKAITFTRIWCGFEIAMTLRSSKSKLYDIASLQSGTPVVLIDGLSAEDRCKGEQYGKDYQGGAQGYKTRREQNFPFHVVEKALSVKIQDGQASVSTDRIRILNSIVAAKDLNSSPPKEHHGYTQVNDALHGRFAAALYRYALEQNWCTLQSELQPALGSSPVAELALCFHECEELRDSSLCELAEALPVSLQSLSLDISGCNNMHRPMLNGIRHLTKLTSLELSFSRCWYLTNLSVLNSLGPCTSLSSLSLDCSMCQRLEDLEELGSLSHLPALSRVSLNFSACASLSDCHAVLCLIDSLPALASLFVDLSGSTIREDRSRMPHSSTTLTELSLNFSRCTHIQDLSSFQGLADLTALEVLSLQFSMCDELSDLSPLQGLAGLEALRSVSLDFSGCTKVDKKQWTIDTVDKLGVLFSAAASLPAGSGLAAVRSLASGSANVNVLEKGSGTEMVITLNPRHPVGLRTGPDGAITSVAPGSQAQRIGVMVGWSVLAVNGQHTSNVVQAVKDAKQAGGSLKITFRAPTQLPSSRSSVSLGAKQSRRPTGSISRPSESEDMHKDEIFIGNTATASAKKEGRWHWMFYVCGDTRHIKSVTLTLHPTFKNPVRTLPGPKFEAKFSGWGTFSIAVSVAWKRGGELRTVWELQFEADTSKLFEVPPEVRCT